MKLPHFGVPALLARRQLAQPEKRAIGKAVAALIPDGASVFINIGTTAGEVARALAERTGLLVITNNLNVVDLLYRRPARRTGCRSSRSCRRGVSRG